MKCGKGKFWDSGAAGLDPALTRVTEAARHEGEAEAESLESSLKSRPAYPGLEAEAGLEKHNTDSYI